MQKRESVFTITVSHSEFPPGWNDATLEMVKILPSKIETLQIDGKKVIFSDPEFDIKFSIISNQHNNSPSDQLQVRVVVTSYQMHE